MSEIRKNAIKNKWVVVAEDRAMKPNDFPIAKNKPANSGKEGFCPFCEGNEEYTPPEIAACRVNNSEPNNKGWLIRAIPNKFSAFELAGVLETKSNGVYTAYNGLGRHEVVIETPEHGVEFHELSTEHLSMIIEILQQRYQELAQDERIKYIQIYKNQGLFAGASLQHSHSQIIGLPFDPGENAGLPIYYKNNGHCLLCNIIKQELHEQIRVVGETDNFIILCPYASRFPYETWIVPKQHAEHFGNLEKSQIPELANNLKRLTSAIMDGLEGPSYNVVINTAPVNTEYEPGYHWYIEVTPRLLVNAGVEIATGIFINPVGPELATEILKKALIKQA